MADACSRKARSATYSLAMTWQTSTWGNSRDRLADNFGCEKRLRRWPGTQWRELAHKRRGSVRADRSQWRWQDHFDAHVDRPTAAVCWFDQFARRGDRPRTSGCACAPGHWLRSARAGDIRVTDSA